MDDLLKLIKTTTIEFPVEITQDCKDLILKMLVMNPADWISIPEILNHPWIHPVSDTDSDKTDSKKSSTTPKEFLADDIQGNINVINVDNIFSESRNKKYEVKLNYDDYVNIS